MIPVNRSIVFVTGTDTGAGKTALACLLTRYLSRAGVSVAALKPVCSGDRADATALLGASDGGLTLDEINPWHFRAPLAPLLAARRERRRLKLSQVLAHVRGIQKRFPIVIVEGAGGLLSPLGEGFDSLDLIESLDAIPLVVCPNRLGAINQSRLVLAALSRRLARRAQVVLMSTQTPDTAGRSNPGLLAEVLEPKQVCVMPWLGIPRQHPSAIAISRVSKTIRALARSLWDK
jgi:dethiobiotin synthase